MRQVVSLVSEGQVQYALVDDDSGEFTPFAIIELPHPERFGLHEAALLGTNLIQAIGLNGHRQQPKAVKAPEPEALPPVRETPAERKRRLARETYHANKHTKRRDNIAQRFVTLDEVMAIVNQYPEGIRLRDMAERLWRQTDGKDGSDMPPWFYTSCSNRLTGARHKLKTKGIPLPFVEEERQLRNKDGVLGKEYGKYLLPLRGKPADEQPTAAPRAWPQTAGQS